jgi:FtsP/CotA-like multicopper oxidase with cupredoxin domain
MLGQDSTPDELKALSRRGFLRGSAVGAAGVAAAAVAACTPGGLPGWTFRPSTAAPSGLPAGSPSPSALATASAAATHAHSPMPSGTAHTADEMDRVHEEVMKRFPEATDKHGNQALAPRNEGGAMVFDLIASNFLWQIDAIKEPVAAMGYNGTWPGPVLRVTEGDLVRINLRNELHESTALHMHGQSLPNPMDGVPFITQPPIKPGQSFTYEFTAAPFGSHMYHSHYNATDQVGKGMLGAFLVEPRDVALRYQVDQEVVWISNDTLGGFTINGKGFPATAPIVARMGDRVLVRFMNEGLMMHPWHLHGMPMRVVARDGYPFGSAEFSCDTLGVNPGERWDVIIDCNNPGVWAFHCHILTHAEGPRGMFGMVTALIVES